MTTIECDLVRRGLESLPDSMLLASIKENDLALKELVDSYHRVSASHSALPEVNEENSMLELKKAMCALPFAVRVKLIYNYMLSTGKIDDEEDYERKFKNLKLSAIKWAVGLIGFLFVATTISVVTVGLIRQDVDTNGFLSSFLGLVKELAAIFFAQ